MSYGFQVDADCSFGQLQVTAFLNIFNDGNSIPLLNALNGSFPDYSLSGNYPPGAHSFEVVVDDGCGNVETAVLPFEVVDCAVDTPVGITGQAFEIPPLIDTDGDGLLDLASNAITPGDFLAEAGQDCTPPLQYSINFEGEGIDPDQDSILLTCDHEGTKVLELSAATSWACNLWTAHLSAFRQIPTAQGISLPSTSYNCAG